MSSQNQKYVPANLLRRLGAIIYDLLLIVALLVLASALVTLPVGMILGPEQSQALSDNPLFILWLASVPAIFFIGFWLRGGQTLGMRAWRLKLISADGSAVTVTQAITRLAGAFISLILLGGGFIWSLLDREKRTLHDILSQTRLTVLPKNRGSRNNFRQSSE